MRKPDKNIVSRVPLAVMLVAAVLISVFGPATSTQRAVAFSMIGGSLAWLVMLLLLLSRTPEGHGRLSSSPPVALDLSAVVPFIAGMFIVDAIGSSGSGGGPSLVGAAAGAVLMVSFSFTVRWLWWEHKRRRVSRWTAGR